MRRVLVAATTGVGLALLLTPGVVAPAHYGSAVSASASVRKNWVSRGKCLDGGGEPVNSPDDWTVVICQGGVYDGYYIDVWA